MAQRYFVVGDVQGCYDELVALLAAARFDRKRTRLAFVGDLINRGPRSREVLELAVAYDALVVVGNHEDGFLRGHRDGTMERLRTELGADERRWSAWMRALPTYLHLDGGGLLVHAGIAPGKRPEECTRAELTRIREVDGRPWFDAWPGPETVIFGHWALRGRVDLPFAKGLDTGCVYGGALTGLYWPALEWVSVPAARVWFDPTTHAPTW